MLEALLTSTLVVALAEVGDKTMLLAIVLAARLRAPWQIVAGIFVATIANHALAALVGREVAGLVESQGFRIAVALGFIAMAAWTLVPDKLDDDEEASVRTKSSAFLTTLVSFFFVEIGDKTQVATIALAAHYRDVLTVAAGTTLGMMIANAPVVWLGDKITRKVPIRAVHLISAVIFLVLGLLAIFAPAT